MREPAAAHRSVMPGAAGTNAPATTNPTIVSTQTALMWQIADGAPSRRCRMRSIARCRRTPHQRAARSGFARATAPCESVCGSVPRSRRFSRRSRSQRRPGSRSLAGRPLGGHQARLDARSRSRPFVGARRRTRRRRRGVLPPGNGVSRAGHATVSVKGTVRPSTRLNRRRRRAQRGPRGLERRRLHMHVRPARRNAR